MPTRNKLAVPANGLSLANLTAEAVYVDWSGSDDGAEPFEVVLPAATYGEWSDRDSAAPEHVDKIAKRTPARPLSDEDREAFEQTEAHDEWRDSYWPVMSYAWPVLLAYGVQLETAAALVDRFGPSCSLVTMSDEAAERLGFMGSDAPDALIALTGGGMDLSDHIAAAYLACGCVPPSRILEGLPGVISERRARELPLRAAYRAAADWHKARAGRLTDAGRALDYRSKSVASA